MTRTILAALVAVFISAGMPAAADAAMSQKQVLKEFAGKNIRFTLRRGNFRGTMKLRNGGRSTVQIRGGGSQDTINGDWGVEKSGRLCVRFANNTSRKRAYICGKVTKNSGGSYKWGSVGTLRK